MITTVLRFAGAVAAAGVLGGPALAQGADLGGPLVAGVCVLSRDAVFAGAKVGKAAFTRYRELQNDAETELAGARRPMEQVLQAFRSAAAKLTVEQRQAQEAVFNTKFQQTQARADQLRRELDATRDKLLQRLSGEMRPVVSEAYKKKGCGLLIDRGSVVGGNMANDLTAAVVQGLDAKITTITFNRETLPSITASEPLER